MSDYLQTVFEHARISILRLLDKQDSRKVNDSILADSLGMLGIDLDRTQVKNQIRWLDKEGLVRVTETPSLLVAELTADGHAVANGRQHDGVKRPTPK